MTLGGSRGGFKAIVRISRSCVSTGKETFYGEMEMEGELSVFDYGSLKEHLRSKIKAEANLQIEFKEYSEENYSGEDEGRYIGDIRLREDNEGVIAYVSVVLPVSMFSLLQSMDGKKIRVDTIHDLISNPTDNKVALVTRIYFETTNDLQQENPQKKFSISIR